MEKGYGAEKGRQAKALDSKLLAALRLGRAKDLRAALEAGADPNAVGACGNSALTMAAEAGDAACAETLLAFGADPNSESAWGQRPLHFAVKHDSEAMAKALVRAGADLEIRNREGRPPVHEAARQGKVRMLDLLAEAGADMGSEDSMGLTPLMSALTLSRKEAALFLAGRGVDFSKRYRHKSVAALAASSDDFETFKLMMGQDFDPDAKDGYESTLAMDLAWFDDPKWMVALLEAKDPDLSLQNNFGKTAEAIAIEHGSGGAAAAIRAWVEKGQIDSAMEPAASAYPENRPKPKGL